MRRQPARGPDGPLRRLWNGAPVRGQGIAIDVIDTTLRVGALASFLLEKPRAQISFPGVRKDDDDVLAFTEFARNIERGEARRAR